MIVPPGRLPKRAPPGEAGLINQTVCYGCSGTPFFLDHVAEMLLGLPFLAMGGAAAEWEDMAVGQACFGAVERSVAEYGYWLALLAASGKVRLHTATQHTFVGTLETGVAEYGCRARLFWCGGGSQPPLPYLSLPAPTHPVKARHPAGQHDTRGPSVKLCGPRVWRGHAGYCERF